MKYIKTFEENNEELLNSLRDLSDKMGQLNSLVKQNRRQFTPKELLEDYFLEIKETDMYDVKINQQFYLISITMENSIPKVNAEQEFNKILNRMKSIKSRIEQIDKYQCHFDIRINNITQSKHNPKTMKNDDYQYMGFGDQIPKYGYINGKYYSSDGGYLQDLMKPERNNYPNDMVPIKIRFFMV